MPLEHRFSAFVLFDNSREITIQICVRRRNGPNLPISSMAAYCLKPINRILLLTASKNPKLLPEKWARTSVVGKLQHVHNKSALIQPIKIAPFMQCEQRAKYTLDYHLPISDTAFRLSRLVIERRAKPRSQNKMTARVWGVDSDDQPFSLDCVLDNISASGLYLRLPRRMKFSASISLAVRLPNGPVDGRFAAITGTVIRDEIEHGGDGALAGQVIEHRFI